MRAHQPSELVQESGCRALKELAVYNATNQEAILSQGGIPVVLRAMETHLAESSVQEVGCGFIRNMAHCSAEHQECIVSRGGVQLLTEAMRVHAAGCWALFCLAVQLRDAEGGGRLRRRPGSA